MSIDNSTGNNFISFNSASRVVTYYSNNDDYGDTTYAVTITGTDP
jgi:hypothetical protein